MWESFIEAVTKVNDWVNGVVWGWPMIIMILGTGILLTVRTRVLQVRKFGESMSTTIVPAVKDMGKKKNKKDKNAVSQFEAFSAAISGTVGTGNIIGVTSAILTGGPGAVLWMWISAFFGMVTNYSENVLGLYYRKKEKDGSKTESAKKLTSDVEMFLYNEGVIYYDEKLGKADGKYRLPIVVDSVIDGKKHKNVTVKNVTVNGEKLTDKNADITLKGVENFVIE